MAKLSDVTFGKTGKSGDKVHFVSSVTVDSTGTFKLSFPDYLEDAMQSLKINWAFNAGKNRVFSETLEKGLNDIGAAIEEYLSYETKEEIVILYGYTNTCHYVKSASGSIYPNGYHCRSDYEEGKAKWNVKAVNNRQKEDCWSHSDDYTVGIKALIRKKVTYIRGNSSSCEYNAPEENELGKCGNLLNSFCKVTFGKDVSDAKELPYNEETAKKFYDAMIALCTVAAKISEIFKDAQNILESKTLLLE